MSETGEPQAEQQPPQEQESVANKILKRNLVNIVRKVQEGRTLSTTELAVVQGIADSGTGEESGEPEGKPVGLVWAQNQVELARELGVNRKTIQRWLKKEGCPGAKSDGRYSVEEFRKWANENNLKNEKEGEGDSKLKLEAKRLLLVNQKIEFDLAIKRGEYTHNEDVEAMFVMMIQNAKKVLLALPSNAAPQVVGLSVPEAELRLREIVDEALAQLQKTWNSPVATD